MAKTKDQEKVYSTSAKVVNENIQAAPINLGKTAKESSKIPYLFEKENYMIMLVGLIVIIIGYVMMSGGKSANPDIFNEDEIYSFRRITLAPILVLLGLAIEGYAIMKKPKAN